MSLLKRVDTLKVNEFSDVRRSDIPSVKLVFGNRGIESSGLLSTVDKFLGIRHHSVQIILDGICPCGVVFFLLKRDELSPLEKIDVGDAFDGVVDVWSGGAWSCAQFGFKFGRKFLFVCSV